MHIAYCVYAYCLNSGHFQPPRILAFSLFGAKSSKGLVSGSSHSNSSGGKQSTIHLNSPLPVSPSLFMINLQNMDNQQYPHIQITEAVDHHLGDGGKRYGRHNPLSLQALPRLRQFLERAPHRWALAAIHSIVHYSMYNQVREERMFASVIVFFLTL